MQRCAARCYDRDYLINIGDAKWRRSLSFD
jgi:hypothetical protein